MGEYSQYKEEIEQKIDEFMHLRGKEQRYASFDFCYLYFYNHRGTQLKENMELSCLHLWSYLASWGMLRGSSELLQKSPACLAPLIEHFSDTSEKLWEIDIDNYTKENIKLLCDEYKWIYSTLLSILNNKSGREKKKKPSITLITKIMLGVYSNIPAFDTNFCVAFRSIMGDECGFRSVAEKSMGMLAKFYADNITAFNGEIHVIGFNGEPTDVKYNKVKLIDMYGFRKGIDLGVSENE